MAHRPAPLQRAWPTPRKEASSPKPRHAPRHHTDPRLGEMGIAPRASCLRALSFFPPDSIRNHTPTQSIELRPATKIHPTRTKAPIGAGRMGDAELLVIKFRFRINLRRGLYPDQTMPLRRNPHNGKTNSPRPHLLAPRCQHLRGAQPPPYSRPYALTL